MGLALVHSRAGVGVAAPEVTVEVHLGGGLPRMSMVGLPETAVREARDRVKAALLNARFNFPQVHITISVGKGIFFPAQISTPERHSHEFCLACGQCVPHGFWRRKFSRAEDQSRGKGTVSNF